MKQKFCAPVAAVLTGFLILIQSCESEKKKPAPENFQYESFKDSLQAVNQNHTHDTSNIFDAREFTPGIDSLDTLLKKMAALWRRDSALPEQIDTLIKRLKKEEKISPEEKEKLKENIRRLDSFFISRNDSVKPTCREKECFIYAAVSKSRQLLYLYIEGGLKDSFPVSTGIKKYRTPDLNGRPSGPLFTKYTSKKFPGGNYKGLGNMPYAVFVRGGYAIHGTTPGNFSKLGTVASHGCIRLHPDNARIFFELVKLFGTDNTWVTVRDSL